MLLVGQKKFELDVWYVDHCSFILDLRIIVLTIKKVFVREGIALRLRQQWSLLLEITNPLDKCIYMVPVVMQKVIIDILRANHEPIEALFDDSEKLYQLLNYPVLHSGEVRGPLIISIGNNSVRKKIAEGVNVDFW